MTQNGDPALCSWCTRLNVRSFFELPLIWSMDQALAARHRGEKTPLERVIGDLIAESGCPLCMMLHDSLKRADTKSEPPDGDLNAIIQYAFHYGLPLNRQVTDTHRYVSLNPDLDRTAFEAPRLLVSMPNRIVQVCVHRMRGPSDASHDGLFRGRIVQSQVDIGLVQMWMAECEAAHQCLSTRPTSFTDWIIDVEEARLVRWDASLQNSRYAALSYVWGGDDVYHLTNTSSTINGLIKPDALRGEFFDVPHTIRDAILLSSLLGIRYLWIDALCIDQGAPHVLTQLASMRGIYGDAYLTIACVDGLDSWHGLPGVGESTRKMHPLPTCPLEGMTLGVAASPASKICGGKWNTRGWTYQEEVVSPRVLYFTNDEVLFSCEGDVLWRESMQLEPTYIRDLSRSLSQEDDLFKPQGPRKPLLPELSHKSWGMDLYLGYVHHLQSYIERNLSDPMDAIRAFEAISEVYAACLNTYQLKGQLANHLTDLLLFTYDLPRPHNCRNLFPSWSWCHWQGDLKVDHFRNKLMRDVAWYRARSVVGGEGLTVTKTTERDTQSPVKSRGFPAAWNKPTFWCDVVQVHERGRTSKLAEDWSEVGTLELAATAANHLDNLLFATVQYLWIEVSLQSDQSDPSAFAITDAHFRWMGTGKCATIRLDPDWRASQPNKLEFIRIAHEHPAANYFKDDRNSRINTLLVETDSDGLSKRVQLQQFQGNYWRAHADLNTRWLCLR